MTGHVPDPGKNPVTSGVGDATPEQVDRVVAEAVAAAPALARCRVERSHLLRAVATALEERAGEVVDLAHRETGLDAAPRLTGEVARTAGQLRLFAAALDAGEDLDVIIDTADPSATPPRPDLRRMQVPLGPVAVFTASNFPFAFGVPGGDTASALAAGCPVVVKAHPGHPQTSALLAGLVAGAVAACGLPPGTFAMVHGAQPEVGLHLVRAEGVTAVGFTGSLHAGRALHDAAAARPSPIPVYAEMGSLNPVFVSPGALAARGDAVADGLAASVTLAHGQMCTKPGVVVVPDTPSAAAFVQRLAAQVLAAAPRPLLYDALRMALERRLDRTASIPGVAVAGQRVPSSGTAVAPVVLQTDAATFVANPQLRDEHFGPVALVVRYDGAEQLDAVVDALPGGLTATVHAEPDEGAWAARLVTEALPAKAGRVVVNGYPTGVAVTDAQTHTGPYPASTAPAHTSVGTTALRRWLRPVTWQDTPDDLLPPALRDTNPLRVPRRVDGQVTTGPLQTGGARG